MTIECPRCKSLNPDAQRFCGDCGGPLDPAYGAIRDLMGVVIKEQVRDVLNENYRDQKSVELETTQAIAARLLDWAKLFGFFVGIPITLLVIGLSAFGIKTYSDFSKLIEKSQKEVTANLEDAQKRAADLRAKGDALGDEYEKLRSQLADSQVLASQVHTLTERVDRIGEKLGFSATSNVSPSVRHHLETAFEKFQTYLQKLGYKADGEKVQVDVRANMMTGAIAYYDPDKRLLVVDSRYSSDPDLLFREYMHSVLYTKKGPPSDPALKFLPFYAIESGLATYFPCSFNGSPRLSEKAALNFEKEYRTWDLSKHRSFDEIKPDIGSVTTDGTEIWGGAFWEIREALGQSAADKLLFTAWFRLKPEDVQFDHGASFVRKLIEIDQATSGGIHQKQIRDIFQRRSLKL